MATQTRYPGIPNVYPNSTTGAALDRPHRITTKEQSVTTEPSKPVPSDKVFETNNVTSSAIRWSGLSEQSAESCMRYTVESCSQAPSKRLVIQCRHRI